MNDNIVLINKSEIIGVVRSALSKIDPRLIDHGERVGYIASKIRDEITDKNSIDFSKLFVLCALHDIGAYKTNEIDDMVKFETEAAFDHSIYGYLFLKNTTHLSKYAEAILYHHTEYKSQELQKSLYAKYAEIIYIADRADILMSSGHANLEVFKSLSGTAFNPEYVDALFKAEEKCNLSYNVASREYKAEADRLALSIEVSDDEILDYLILLVYAIDFRSPYTVTHTADTVLISREIGKLMNLSNHDMQALYLGSFLHDIGKIAIPHSILEKPGKLTPEEFEIVKTHIDEGENILRGIISDEICDIALRHHEKLNGKGYAKGIASDDLTVTQRIVAVADITSALTQKRSYKEPFPKEKVIGILEDMKNTNQICPNVVDIVVNNYDSILTNTEKSHDPVKMMYDNLRLEYKEKKEEQKNAKRAD